MNLKTLIISLIVLQFSVHLPADAQIMLDPVINPPLYKSEIILPDIGLSSSLIECIYEDQYGFIWIGTQYGLDRYDGYSVTRMSDVVYQGKEFSMEWIWSISEDLQGTLWVCSSRGLFQYDRRTNSFEMLLPNPDDPFSFDNQVLMARQDSRGIHWVFTKGGLFSYNPEQDLFTDYKKDSIIGQDKYWGWWLLMSYNSERYLEDSSGNIWICTLNGLKMYDPETDGFKTYRHDPENPESISGNGTASIKEDKYGNLWVKARSPISEDDELNRILDVDRGIFKHYTCDPPDKQNITRKWMYPIYISSDSNMWIGGHNGFYRFDYQTDKLVSYYLPGNDSPRGIVWDIEEGPNGNLWMVREGEGVSLFDPGSGKAFYFRYNDQDPNNILPSNYSSILINNESKSLWFLHQNAISRAEPLIKQFHTTLTKTYLKGSQNDPTVITVYYDSRGALWFGAGYGLFKSKGLNPGGINKYNQVTDYGILCLNEDSRGQLWMGSFNHGLGRFNENTNHIKWFGFHDHADSLNKDIITSMYEDNRGLFWVVPANAGLNIFSREHERFISLFNDRENPDEFYDWYVPEEDQKGDMWFGSFVHGLSKLEMSEGLADSIEMVFNKELEVEKLHFRVKDYRSTHLDKQSLGSDLVVDLHSDKSGRLWIGTTNGLNLYNETDDNFYLFTMDDGLPDNSIMGILEDDHGNLWLSSLKGICKVVLEDGIGPDIIKSVHSYRKEDGLQGDLFFEKSKHNSADGWMCFGGSWGFTVFHPDSIGENQEIPPVYITDIQINDQSLFSQEDPLLDRDLFVTEEISLPYRQNSLAFEYVALNFSNSEQNQYRYMMEGLDDNWVEAGTRRFAEYRDLKPGSYIFRVLGSNDDGLWNEEGASIGIVIKPPWYRSIIAYLAYLILLSAAVYGYIQWRTRMLKKERDELEEVVRERTSTIQDQNKSILNANTQLEEQKEELEQQKEELEQQTEELQQQKEELQNTLDRLKDTQDQLIQSEKLAALGGLVAGVAHEINTPVGISVTAASNLVEETKEMAEKYKTNKISKSDFKDYLSTANQSAKLILANMQRTAEMVQSFKLVSADQSTGEKRRVVLRSYMEDIIRSLYPKLKGRRISINLDVDPNLEVESYPGAVSQIFTNLILNSLTHGFEEDEKGEIMIRSILDGGILKTNFIDNGKGISENSLTKIFDPFFTTNKKVGTGLGLNIVYNLVTQKLNGSIECNSKPGEGVEFKIEIPVD